MAALSHRVLGISTGGLTGFGSRLHFMFHDVPSFSSRVI